MVTEKIQDAWNLTVRKLFCPDTSLIYDSLSSPEFKRRFDHLPYPEEIRKQIPNPSGWGTGMEDCMLNAGTMLDVCAIRAEREPENHAESLAFAAKLIDGMESCVRSHGVPGFVVRGISPRDGRSCYINSSRDQFTLFVYGLWRYLHVPGASAEHLKRARNMLTLVADYCRKTILPENDYNLLRLDGKPALVSKMQKVDPHEAYRLPMIYLAAWEASGNARYQVLYEQYANRALIETEQCAEQKSWINWAFIQLQASLRLGLEVDPDGYRKKRIASLMRKVAASGIGCFENAEKQMLAFDGAWNAPAEPWQYSGVMTIRDETQNPGHAPLSHGYLYLMPRENKAYMKAFDALRSLGNYAAGIGLAPSFESGKLLPRFLKCLEKVEFSHQTSCGACNILHGYYRLLMQNIPRYVYDEKNIAVRPGTGTRSAS